MKYGFLFESGMSTSQYCLPLECPPLGYRPSWRKPHLVPFSSFNFPQTGKPLTVACHSKYAQLNQNCVSYNVNPGYNWTGRMQYEVWSTLLPKLDHFGLQSNGFFYYFSCFLSRCYEWQSKLFNKGLHHLKRILS